MTLTAELQLLFAWGRSPHCLASPLARAGSGTRRYRTIESTLGSVTATSIVVPSRAGPERAGRGPAGATTRDGRTGGHATGDPLLTLERGESPERLRERNETKSYFQNKCYNLSVPKA